MGKEWHGIIKSLSSGIARQLSRATHCRNTFLGGCTQMVTEPSKIMGRPSSGTARRPGKGMRTHNTI